ncbi:hypothetical protein EVAR_96223_1 [Eumeta japonica]|uniref:Uncharacterized protein n=1 Tax=Eumeta variegata TaxID=151549 RepID=A0A4C1WNC8_EUMVA|nr:hypothetical protein EVAR_96223_1 [Eumeta japonica]
MELAARTKNMTLAALPRSEAFHLGLEVQARARNERQRGTTGLRVRQRSTSISLLLDRAFASFKHHFLPPSPAADTPTAQGLLGCQHFTDSYPQRR